MFYKHPMMSDGHLNMCKECSKSKAKTYRFDADGNSKPRNMSSNVSHREYDRERSRTELRKKWVAEYNKKRKEENPEEYRRKRREYNAKGELFKKRARLIFYRAVKSGKIHRPDGCEKCGGKCVPHGHHTDYSKPLNVMWLCTKCHGERHREFPV